jgi:hypothetical protein
LGLELTADRLVYLEAALNRLVEKENPKTDRDDGRSFIGDDDEGGF